MIGASRDLPLAADASSRFLPWIVGGMVYLAALTLAAGMIVSSAGGDWRSGLSNTLTVQIMPAGAKPPGKKALDRRVAKALELLRATPGVMRATALTEKKTRALVEPWLGAAAGTPDLPLPRLIDVAVDPDTALDSKALAARLAKAVPGATLDDHGDWLGRLLALAAAVEVVAGCVILLICAAAVMTVVFTTRTGLAIHLDVIEVLHLIGARDAYVARQFQSHALILTLKGGLIGAALAALTVVGLEIVAAGLESTLLPDIALGPLQWLGIAALPFAAAAISMATARFTVMRQIGRMM